METLSHIDIVMDAMCMTPHMTYLEYHLDIRISLRHISDILEYHLFSAQSFSYSVISYSVFVYIMLIILINIM